jgi:twitching motility protein PilU
MTVSPYLKLMAEKAASDLFFTTGAPVCMKLNGVTQKISKTPLQPGTAKKIAYEIMNDQQIKDFELTKEMNLGISIVGGGRFRVNIYYQRGEVSLVIRYIKHEIPSLEKLGLPDVLRSMVMKKNGLILVVGATGSGKSTSLASMIEHRNHQQSGHILTIEDPIEYIFTHKKSIIGQREVGLDTLSYDNALREAMREAPDVIMIGEVRDRLTMEAAMSYADTGHLCLTTLHAVNANQALDRIINFFPTDARNQILMDLSLNLAGIISQRLIPATDGGRIPAVEVLLNTPYISELIRKGEFGGIKEIMEKGAAVGMQTFDQCLHELFKSERITMDEALNFADSRSNLEWQINFGGGVKSVGQHDDKDDLVLSADELGSDNESANPITLSTPLPDLSELNLDGEGQEELKSFSDVSLDHDLNENAIEDDDDDFFDSVKSMFSDDRPSKS